LFQVACWAYRRLWWFDSHLAGDATTAKAAHRRPQHWASCYRAAENSVTRRLRYLSIREQRYRNFIMVHRVKDLSAQQRLAIESILGRALLTRRAGLSGRRGFSRTPPLATNVRACFTGIRITLTFWPSGLRTSRKRRSMQQ